MKLIRSFFFLSLFLIFSSTGKVPDLRYDPDWEFRKETNGISVYTRDIEESNLKELKIYLSFNNTNLISILKVLKDITSYRTWVYSCSESRLVTELNENEKICYYRFDFPWPMSDRDIYISAITEIAPDKKSATITTKAIKDIGVREEGIVRVEDHLNRWEFQETGDRVDLVYFLKSDPAGKLPDWVVNLAIDKGPINTLSNLRNLVQQ